MKRGMGGDGLDVLKENPGIETVILDLNMPITDGYDFLTGISKSSLYDHIKIYIASATDCSKFEEDVAKKGISIHYVCGYFQKPILMQKLANIIVDN